MRKIAMGLLIITLSSSCKKDQQFSKKVDSDTIRVYEYEQMETILDTKNKGKKIIVVDASCSENENQAHLDIKNGKIKYFFYTRIFTTTMEVEEMKKRFANSKIHISYAYGGSCIPIQKEDEINCYESAMNSEVKKRFGTKFVDSIQNVRNLVRLECSKNR